MNRLFFHEFENNIKKTIKQFRLISRNDKILVAASGGKDSTTILYLLKKFGYNVEALTIDAAIGNYTRENLENLVKFCGEHNIKLHIVSFKDEFGYSLCYIKSTLQHKGINLKSCTICGVLRRYLVNKHARKLKADKLVTGHNMDDEAQALMMNLFRNTLWLAARLGPKTGLHASRYFVPRVKPLYLTSTRDIIRYSKLMGFPVKYHPCPCSTDSYRRFVREMLNEWEQKNPALKRNIINYFLRIMPKLKKVYTRGEISVCTKCNEPSSHKICKTCQILDNFKNNAS